MKNTYSILSLLSVFSDIYVTKLYTLRVVRNSSCWSGDICPSLTNRSAMTQKSSQLTTPSLLISNTACKVRIFSRQNSVLP